MLSTQFGESVLRNEADLNVKRKPYRFFAYSLFGALFESSNFSHLLKRTVQKSIEFHFFPVKLNKCGFTLGGSVNFATTCLSSAKLLKKGNGKFIFDQLVVITLSSVQTAFANHN